MSSSGGWRSALESGKRHFLPRGRRGRESALAASRRISRARWLNGVFRRSGGMGSSARRRSLLWGESSQYALQVLGSLHAREVTRCSTGVDASKTRDCQEQTEHKMVVSSQSGMVSRCEEATGLGAGREAPVAPLTFESQPMVGKA